jgi:hypothetical protein
MPATQASSSFAPPSVLPDISPSRGEIALISPIALVQATVDAFGSCVFEAGATAKLPISPLEGEMSGRTEGGATKRKAQKDWQERRS